MSVGVPGRVVGIEPHALEPPVEGRTSIVSDGVVVLHYMPKAVHVRLPRILARAVSIGRILF